VAKIFLKDDEVLCDIPPNDMREGDSYARGHGLLIN